MPSARARLRHRRESAPRRRVPGGWRGSGEGIVASCSGAMAPSASGAVRSVSATVRCSSRYVRSSRDAIPQRRSAPRFPGIRPLDRGSHGRGDRCTNRRRCTPQLRSRKGPGIATAWVASRMTWSVAGIPRARIRWAPLGSVRPIRWSRDRDRHPRRRPRRRPPAGRCDRPHPGGDLGDAVEVLGCTVVVKFENLQFIASFKERGARNKLAQPDTAPSARRGVVAVSAGNHAQAVARHARLLGIDATIVMPETDAVREGRPHEALGAAVELYGETVGRGDGPRRSELVERAGPHVRASVRRPARDRRRRARSALELLADHPDLDVARRARRRRRIARRHVAWSPATSHPQVELVGVQTEALPVDAAGARAVTTTPGARRADDGRGHRRRPRRACSRHGCSPTPAPRSSP